MSTGALGIDAYQLTTLVAHSAAGRLAHQVAMSVFFRRLPRQRNFVVYAGLRHILEWCETLAFDARELAFLAQHPVLGPAFAAQPAALEALRALQGFAGEIESLPEGTLAFAGPLHTEDGALLRLGEGPDAPPVSMSTPLLQVRTDLVRAKLLETPWLSRVNHLCMVASKAARLVLAAGDKPVMEFGQRRTHPQAALDASYAAYLAGCASTSNLAAEAHFGIPARGTMDHFAVQASAAPGANPEVAQFNFFKEFVELFPEANTLLVDTYDTLEGVRQAAVAGGTRLQGVRLDSAVTPELVRQTRALLDASGAPQALIYASDGLDEFRVRELCAAGADGFGVGENITCSPDAATGVGAVAKLVHNGYGRSTMKVAGGSGKATLPGPLQVWRTASHDLLTLADEGGPSGATPLLQPVWRGKARLGPLPSLEAARAHVQRQLAALAEPLRALEVAAEPWPMVVSERLAAHTRRLAAGVGSARRG